jgi:cell division protein FtsB
MEHRTSAPYRRRNLSKVQQFFAHLRATIAAWFRMPLKQSGVHLVTFALALVTVSLLVNFITQVVQSANLEAQRTELEAEVSHLEGEIARLRAAVEYAESDVHVERVAREQLGYAREGDIVVLPRYLAPTPTPTPEQADTAAEQAAPTVRASNWQRWWQAFAPREQIASPDS